MKELIELCLHILLIGSIGMLSYSLGRRKEKNEMFEEKKKAIAEIRRLRDSLNSSGVVDRLHNRFRR